MLTAKRNVLVNITTTIGCYALTVLGCYVSSFARKDYGGAISPQATLGSVLMICGPFCAIVYTLWRSRKVKIRDDYLPTLLPLVIHLMFLMLIAITLGMLPAFDWDDD